MTPVEKFKVAKWRGLDLAVGQKVWLQEQAGMYDDGGYFATVEAVDRYEPNKYVHGVEVVFAKPDPILERQRMTFLVGQGSDEYVLVLVEEDR